MQANWREIAKAFNENQHYVLATIIETRGATYQKVGAMMLINNEGDCFGLLSGGCLEADISLHAKQVLLQERSNIIRYDLSSDADLLWGLGLGCDGAIDILLQPLLPVNNHFGFGYLLNSLKAQKSGCYLQSLPLHTLNSNELLGSLSTFKPYANFVPSDHIEYTNLAVVSTSITELGFEAKEKSKDEGQYCLVTPIYPPINLLICGAGPDVVPVVNFAEQMGWQVTLWDHRKSHLQEPPFSSFQRRCVRAKDTHASDYIDFDAVVVMTHNLSMDAEYLAKLNAISDVKLRYIGLLGPSGRRDKLLAMCELDLSQVQHRIHGPIGLNLGGRGAEAIALSVISEIQQHFFTHASTAQKREQSIICSVNDAALMRSKANLLEVSNKKVLTSG